jgi:6-phosphofructo-2-kinase
MQRPKHTFSTAHKAATTGQTFSAAQAVKDFKARIAEYEKVYEPITDGQSNRHMHFVQLNNMVTGRGYMDINRISGYLPSKIVFCLMQVPPARPACLAQF